MIPRQIYHISLLTAFAVTALLSSACSADDNSGLSNNPADDRQPVAFSAAMADSQEAETRAAPKEMDLDRLESSGFGVFACYTGLHKYGDVDVQPDFMYNQQVTWNSSTWTYSPVKYWPIGEGEVSGSMGTYPHYLSFMAYAPYSDMSTGDAGYCIPSMSPQREVGNPWITYRLHTDPADQVDLLYAKPLLNKTKEDATLPFEFQHALACAGSSVTVTASDAMQTYLQSLSGGGATKMELRLTAMTITYQLTEKGRLVLWNNGSANWQSIDGESSMATRVVDYAPSNYLLYSSAGDGMNYTDDNHGVFYIPIHVGNNYQTATVELTYEIWRYTGPSTYVIYRTASPSAVLTLSDYGGYEAGKKYAISLHLGMSSVNAEATIEDWDPAVDIDATDSP